MLPTRTVATTARPRGFSLLEALLVVAVIALLAGLVVPRLGGLQRREERLAADRAADLLTMFAFRSAAGTQPVGLMYDPAEGRLELLIYDVDPTVAEMPVVWQPDRLSMPVLLPESVQIVDATEGRNAMPPGAWMIASRPGGERPRVSWRVAGDAIEVSMVLEPYALHPQRSDRRISAGARAPRDLGREGMDRSRW
jgi:prepilin-type N-terminal cleavage/methylation domain-containing protein